MFSKQFVSFVTIALSVLSVSEQVLGRERWLERDNKAVLLHPRRFGQEHPAVIDQLGAACPGQVCGVLSGSAISTLLAASPECDQQNMADSIIDAAQQFDATTKANMIALAKTFRQVEKNTPPDFTTNPPTNRNSVFCQTAPKNAELNGLVQAQDPANDPNLFFDPATKASVTLGSQANTFPFGSSGSGAASSATNASSTAILAVATDSASDAGECTQSVVTVTVSSTDASSATGSCSLVTMTIGADATSTSGASATSVATSAAAASTAVASNIGDFGSCTVPQIQFATGFDNRKETSFEPVDQTSYNHGSAQNIDIITQFMCDTLTNSCGADQTAKDTCATARTAADGQTAKTGAQADAFNAVFGITTNFASVAAVDNQGNVIAGTGSAVSSAAVGTLAASATASPATISSAATSSAAAANTAVATGSSSTIGDFGSCTVPQIEFATGFDNRKETSFEPVDKTSFNHGSAQNIDIITQFICDTLTNSCGADQTAKDTCATARTAADGQTAKTGAQADAFNAVFGITTNFAAVAAVDDKGNVIAGTGSGAAAASTVAASSVASSAATEAATTASSSVAAAATTAASTSSTSGNIQAFAGSLGATAPAVTDLGNGQFQVDGNSAFNSLQNALVRSCDVQHNKCANAANASGNSGALTVSACGDQQTQCNAQAATTAASA